MRITDTRIKIFEEIMDYEIINYFTINSIYMANQVLKTTN